MCADTLYVVVGTLFENSSMFVSRGRAITRPSHCYKLLLRTRNGNSGKAISQITDPDEIMAIGFLYENSAEGNVEPYQAVVSIAEIEARAGIKFYPTLHPSVANSVKNQKNIADWKAFR
jgi:endonuclease G